MVILTEAEISPLAILNQRAEPAWAGVTKNSEPGTSKMSVEDLQTSESSTAQAKSTKQPDVLCFDQSKVENFLFSKKIILNRTFSSLKEWPIMESGKTLTSNITFAFA